MDEKQVTLYPLSDWEVRWLEELLMDVEDDADEERDRELARRIMTVLRARGSNG